MDQLLADVALRITALLGHLGVAPSEESAPADLDELLRAYSELKSRTGGAEIAERLGVSAQELSAFERDMRDLARRVQRASQDEDSATTRNRRLAALMVLSWFELLLERGLDLPESETATEGDGDLAAARQVRAIELQLRAVVTESSGGQEKLEQELRERFGAKTVEAWLRVGDSGDLLSGTTFGEVASLVAA